MKLTATSYNIMTPYCKHKHHGFVSETTLGKLKNCGTERYGEKEARTQVYVIRNALVDPRSAGRRSKVTPNQVPG